MKPLPEFKERPYNLVEKLIKQVLRHGEMSYLLALVDYDDGHYRAIFDPAYFILAEGQVAPSKSQWSTLKKRLKRYDDRVFIFKEYGSNADGTCYLDFGFFAH